MKITRKEMLEWLQSVNPLDADELFRIADRIRYEFVGDEVHLRGLVEFSNYCSRSCQYCGIAATSRDVQRYRMSQAEILECAREIKKLNYGTIVLQSGEDWGVDTAWVAELLKMIKGETGLAITLSLGEREPKEFEEWFAAGADRYLLRFETSNQGLYAKIHPNLANKVSDRFAILRSLRKIGYEIGSGVMVGIPGQSYEDLVNDLLMFKKLDLDMIGIGPYIAAPGTPLSFNQELRQIVPATVSMACKVVALARIVCPKSNIPSTTALATLEGASGRLQGLSCGANVLMPNVTPEQYRRLYAIYPDKTALNEEEEHFSLAEWLKSFGRKQGQGRGDSVNILERMA